MKTILITVWLATPALLPAHASTIIFNSGTEAIIESFNSDNNVLRTSSTKASKAEAAIPHTGSIFDVTFHHSPFGATNVDIPLSAVDRRDISSSYISVQENSASDQTLARCDSERDQEDLLSLVVAIAFSKRGLLPKVPTCGGPFGF